MKILESITFNYRIILQKFLSFSLKWSKIYITWEKIYHLLMGDLRAWNKLTNYLQDFKTLMLC